MTSVPAEERRDGDLIPAFVVSSKLSFPRRGGITMAEKTVVRWYQYVNATTTVLEYCNIYIRHSVNNEYD